MEKSEQNILVGDAIRALAREYADEANKSEFATTLRGLRISKCRYLGLIAGMYPIVIGFNRALIRSISKVDHVRLATFVRDLAEQVQEEQGHNQLWRNMLTAHGIGHEALHRALEEYLIRFSNDELVRMANDVLTALRRSLQNTSPGCFPQPVFPEPVLALYHHLWMTASCDDIDFWEHFGGQFGMEAMIFEVVSTSIFPGVVGKPELSHGPGTIEWWKEHAKQGGTRSGKRSSEEKHIELARIALNKSKRANAMRAQVLTRAEDTMRLFVATMISHDVDKVSFPVKEYLR